MSHDLLSRKPSPHSIAPCPQDQNHVSPMMSDYTDNCFQSRCVRKICSDVTFLNSVDTYVLIYGVKGPSKISLVGHDLQPRILRLVTTELHYMLADLLHTLLPHSLLAQEVKPQGQPFTWQPSPDSAISHAPQNISLFWQCKNVLALSQFSIFLNMTVTVDEAKADNAGLRSVCIQFYEQNRTQYLQDNPGCRDSFIKDIIANDLFWILNIKIGDITSEVLFQGWSLQQLVDAVFEHVEVKAHNRRSWTFLLQGSLLSEPIGDYTRNFTWDSCCNCKSWCLSWDKIRLPVLVPSGEMINVELIPKNPASSSAVSAGLFASWLRAFLSQWLYIYQGWVYC